MRRRERWPVSMRFAPLPQGHDRGEFELAERLIRDFSMKLAAADALHLASAKNAAASWRRWTSGSPRRRGGRGWRWRSWLTVLCLARHEFFEKQSVKLEAFLGLEAEFKFFQHVHKPFAVDQFDWWNAVPGGLPPGFRRECSRRDHYAFVRSSGHCAAKISYMIWAH